MNKEKIKEIFQESIDLKKMIIDSNSLEVIPRMGDKIVNAIMKGNKLLICGNGGSAADAQHLAAELLIRLKPSHNRQGIPAIALTQDVSTLTACGNDFGFDKIYERLVDTLGKKGDVLLAISTSGNSQNILNAIKSANINEIDSVAFLGSGGGKAVKLCEENFIVPSNNTARIQECHITIGHILMEYIEDRLIELNFLNII